ncbi:MAG: archease [Nitrososphaeria archaeon]|nr:archease [Nitrososphaeria archaeon]
MCSFYRILEHVSDAYVEVSGSSLEECFSKAGLAVVDIMVDLDSISPTSSLDVKVEGFDLYSLLYNFLEDVLVRVSGGEFLPCKIDTKIDRASEGFILYAKYFGEPFALGKHRAKVEVKAVTYHLMEIVEKDDECVIRFLLDL